MDRSKLPKEVARLKRLIRRPTLDELILIDMRRDYAHYRAKYFSNSIPPVDAMLFGVASVPTMARASGRGCYGFYVPSDTNDVGVMAIVVSKDCDSALRGTTMLHEMAHIKVDIKFGRHMGHGKHWNGEMKRLAKLGAFEKVW